MTSKAARTWSAVACCLMAAVHTEAAQAPPPRPLTLLEAVDVALDNHPAIPAAEGQSEAARAGVDAARIAYLPRADLLWQQNRGTRDNVSGTLIPQGVVPAISGPIGARSPTGGVWGSATGLLFSWEPVDFGRRGATVTAAREAAEQADASTASARLRVAVQAADAFLAAVTADEIVRAAQISVDRLDVFERSVAALVQNALRPGADGSRAAAELAVARVQLARAQADALIARATLGEALGLPGLNVVPSPGTLTSRLPELLAPAPSADPAAHPEARVRAAGLRAVQARERALDRSAFPRINLQSAWYARGVVPPDADGTGADGLFPETSNWAVGVTVTFPVFDVVDARARRRIEAGRERTAEAVYDETVRSLRADTARARAALEAARLVAETTPVELQAAQDAERQARARYDAGLATLTEVAETERLLAQAESEDRAARVRVWQALLAVAGARGDLAPFLDRVRTGGVTP